MNFRVYAKAGQVLLAVTAWILFHAGLLKNQFQFEWSLGITDSIVSNGILLITAALGGAALGYMPKASRVEYIIGFSLIFAFADQWISEWILAHWQAQHTAYISFLAQSETIRSGINFLVIMGYGVAAIFYLQLKEQEEVARRETATNTMVKEAELQKLQTQLQPHFLFNCLNSINAMIMLRPQEAREMVQQLSDFLRLTLKRADEHWITFSDEVKYLENYLSIEKIRFGHRLDIKIEEGEETKAWRMPTLLLQPLVENAIKFGLYGTTGNVTIDFAAWIKDEMLHIRVANPFDEEAQPPQGSGFGLSGLRRRLYLLFGRNDLVETTIQENIFTVILKIPRYS